MTAKGVHHVALAVNDAAAAHAFYRDVVGLQPIERPEGGADLPGSWFDTGPDRSTSSSPKT